MFHKRLTYYITDKSTCVKEKLLKKIFKEDKRIVIYQKQMYKYINVLSIKIDTLTEIATRN